MIRKMKKRKLAKFFPKDIPTAIREYRRWDERARKVKVFYRGYSRANAIISWEKEIRILASIATGRPV